MKHNFQGLFFLYGILLAIFFSSCASLTNNKTTQVNFSSNVDSARVRIKDSKVWHTLPAKIEVKRSNTPKYFTYKTDSVQIPIKLHQNLSSSYLVGNIPTIYGYLIDLTNTKRFTYPKYVEIIQIDSDYIVDIHSYIRPKQGLWELKISIPFINIFEINNGFEETTYGGFYGFSTGFNYYITDIICLNLDMGIISNFPTPFPSFIDYDEQEEHLSALFGDLQLGIDLEALHLDFGIQYNKTRYEVMMLGSNNHYYSQINFGMAFSTSYKINDFFNMELNYYPSFYSTNNSGWRKEKSGIISLGFTLKLKVNE